MQIIDTLQIIDTRCAESGEEGIDDHTHIYTGQDCCLEDIVDALLHGAPGNRLTRGSGSDPAWFT